MVLFVSLPFGLIQKLTSIQTAGGKADVDSINPGTSTVTINSQADGD